MRALLIVAIWLYSTFPAHSWAGEYEDCILQHMKGVTNNIAASEIKSACFKKYTKEVKLDRRLVDEHVTGNMLPVRSLSRWPSGSEGWYAIVVKNGTAYRLTKIIIQLSSKDKTEYVQLGNSEFQGIRAIDRLHVLPYSQQPFYIDIRSFKDNVEWAFVEVWGTGPSG